jgi:hypothetical protein
MRINCGSSSSKAVAAGTFDDKGATSKWQQAEE